MGHLNLVPHGGLAISCDASSLSKHCQAQGLLMSVGVPSSAQPEFTESVAPYEKQNPDGPELKQQRESDTASMKCVNARPHSALQLAK
jgi:hypothetical protein